MDNDPGTLFDALADWKHRPASTRASGLRLAMEPRAVHLPTVPREIGKIDDGLRAKIRELVTGKAEWPLLLHGPAGTGKTSAALCLLDLVHDGKYATAGEWAGWLADAMADRKVSLPWWTKTGSGERQYMRKAPTYFLDMASKADLFVIDELATRTISDHHYDCLKRLIDLREGKPLIAISNLSPEELEKLYDDRVVSRLAAGTVLRLGGQDRRVKKTA